MRSLMIARQNFEQKFLQCNKLFAVLVIAISTDK